MSLTDLSLAILEKGLEGGHQVCLGDLLAHSRLQKITISKRGRRVVKNLKNSSFKCFSLGKLKYKICGSLLLTHYFKCSSNVQGFFMTAYLEFNVTRLSLIETLYIVTKVQKQMLILIKYRSWSILQDFLQVLPELEPPICGSGSGSSLKRVAPAPQHWF